MVGRNFIAHAGTRGWNVVAPGRRELDLLDGPATMSYFADTQPDVVVHCAGVVGGIRANMAAPYDFGFENLLLGANVVNAAVHARVPRLVNLGSSCMYPRNAPNPLRESAILTGQLEPTNEAYAVAKIATARLCDYATQQHGLTYKTVVPCNLYGLHDNFDADSAHLIPAVIRKIHDAVVTGSKSVEIWGDGTARREFMFAGDLADFLCLAIERLDDLEAYTNVGLGFDYSINEYYSAVAETIGFEGEFTHDLSRPVGMQQKLVDVSRQTQLGWKPSVPLGEGLKKVYDYYVNEVIG